MPALGQVKESTKPGAVPSSCLSGWLTWPTHHSAFTCTWPTSYTDVEVPYPYAPLVETRMETARANETRGAKITCGMEVGRNHLTTRRITPGAKTSSRFRAVAHVEHKHLVALNAKALAQSTQTQNRFEGKMGPTRQQFRQPAYDDTER